MCESCVTLATHPLSTKPQVDLGARAYAKLPGVFPGNRASASRAVVSQLATSQRNDFVSDALPISSKSGES